MKRLLHIITILFFTLTLLLASPNAAFASEEDSGHLEVEVNGYHVALTSQNGWIKGENIITVSLTDEMGMPVREAEVDILILPKADEHAESDEHGVSETDEHAGSDADGHTQPEADEGEEEHISMSGMEMDESESETVEASAHDEASMDPVTMTASAEAGVYMTDTHFASSGEHDVHVMFHIHGELLQADFVVEIAGTSSKTVVLWSFFLVNVALITSAGALKNQSRSAKRQVMA